MRILVCGINYAPDLIGIAKYNTELCEALAGFGHDVRVVTAPPYYPEWKIPPEHRSWIYRSERRAGVAIKRAPIYVPSQPSGRKRLVHHASFALTSAFPVIFQALRWRPQLMLSVAPSLMSSAAVAMAARRAGAVSWLHLQDLEVDAAFGLGLLRDGRLRKSMLAIERRAVLRSRIEHCAANDATAGAQGGGGASAARIEKLGRHRRHRAPDPKNELPR